MITPLSNSFEHLSRPPGKTRNYLGGKYGLIRRLPFACNCPDDSRRHCLESCTRLRLFCLSGLSTDQGPVWSGLEWKCQNLVPVSPTSLQMRTSPGGSGNAPLRYRRMTHKNHRPGAQNGGNDLLATETPHGSHRYELTNRSVKRLRRRSTPDP